MMNINQMIGRDEGKTLEFKRDLSSPRNILKTLTAFANTAGGVLLMGIEDVTKNVLGNTGTLPVLIILQPFGVVSLIIREVSLYLMRNKR